MESLAGLIYYESINKIENTESNHCTVSCEVQAILFAHLYVGFVKGTA